MKNTLVSFSFKESGRIRVVQGHVINDAEKESGIRLENIKVVSEDDSTISDSCYIPWHLICSKVKISKPKPKK